MVQDSVFRAKFKVVPDFKVWDGTYDYSFYKEGKSDLYIYTPEQFAAFCVKSSSIVGGGITVHLMRSVIMYADYEENFDWVDRYNSSSNKKPKNPLGETVSMTATINSGVTFNGHFHSIVGMYSVYGLTRNENIRCFVIRQNSTVKNLYLDHCSAYGTDCGALFTQHREGSEQNPTIRSYLKNIQAIHCKVAGYTRYTGSLNWGILYAHAGYNYKYENLADIYNCGLVDCYIDCYDSSGYAYYRENGIIKSGFGNYGGSGRQNGVTENCFAINTKSSGYASCLYDIKQNSSFEQLATNIYNYGDNDGYTISSKTTKFTEITSLYGAFNAYVELSQDSELRKVDLETGRFV